MKKNIFLLVFAIMGYASHAQTGIGTLNPHASSALDISLANKGVLLSRVALKGTTDTSTIPAPANSLLVYNTATINDITQGYYYWSTMSSRWIRVIDTASIVPAWSLTGNNNTIAGTNFIGTRDNQDLVFKRNNIQAGRLAVSNTSFGLSALKSNVGGSPNTAIGNEALESNINGYYNTATGYQTLKNSTGNSGNTAFGHAVLGKLVKGNFNVGVGMHSLQDLKEGIHNLAIGTGALDYITASNYNIGIGSGAGSSLNGGDSLDGFNTIIGSYNDRAQGLKSGINNTILGSRIMLPYPISNNIIIADGKGNRRINVNELGNVGLGTTLPHASAALHIGGINKGVLLPQVPLTSTTDVTTIPLAANSLMIYNTLTVNDVAPGYYYWNSVVSKWIRVMDSAMPITAWGLKGNTGNTTTFIGTTNDQDVVFKRNNKHSGSLAGTNTSFGQHSLESNNSSSSGNSAFGIHALQNNTVGNNNTAIGTLALYRSINNIDNVAVGLGALCRLEKGNYNVALGSNALYDNKTGSYNIAIGYMAGDDLLMLDNPDAFNIMIGSKTAKGLVKGIKNTILGSNIVDLPADLSNSIIIGEGAKTSVNNSIRLGNTSISSFTGQVAYSFASDKRYKTDIKTIPLGLDFVNKLNPVEYIRKNNTSNTKEWGFIAQELQQTLQEENYKDAGIVQDDGSVDKMLSVRYTDLIAPMVKAMQELTEHNEFLNNRINQLEAKLEKLSK